MPMLLKSQTVKARKVHACCTCHTPAVRPGEEYRRDTYVFDGRVYDWVMCTACIAIEGFVFAWCDYVDDGIGAEQYDEWARDTGWGADNEPEAQTDEQKGALAYLARRGMIVAHSWVGVAGHPDDPECAHREDGTDATYCGEPEYRHLWSTR